MNNMEVSRMTDQTESKATYGKQALVKDVAGRVSGL